MKLSKEVQANMKKIKALEDKYHPMVFRMGFVRLFSAGHANFDEMFIDEGFKQILEDEETEKTTGEKSPISPDLRREIWQCAVELSVFRILTLFTYIKKHLYIKT